MPGMPPRRRREGRRSAGTPDRRTHAVAARHLPSGDVRGRCWSVPETTCARCVWWDTQPLPRSCDARKSLRRIDESSTVEASTTNDSASTMPGLVRLLDCLETRDVAHLSQYSWQPTQCAGLRYGCINPLVFGYWPCRPARRTDVNVASPSVAGDARAPARSRDAARPQRGPAAMRHPPFAAG